MEEVYLDVKELCTRIKYKPQTIYNNIHKGVFVFGKHFIKPARGKLLFKWSGILEWLGEAGNCINMSPPPYADSVTDKKTPKSLIKV